jgi:hypothetical protein
VLGELKIRGPISVWQGRVSIKLQGVYIYPDSIARSSGQHE